MWNDLNFINTFLGYIFLSGAEGSQMYKCKCPSVCPSVCPPFLNPFPMSVHRETDMVDAYGKN